VTPRGNRRVDHLVHCRQPLAAPVRGEPSGQQVGGWEPADPRPASPPRHGFTSGDRRARSHAVRGGGDAAAVHPSESRSRPAGPAHPQSRVARASEGTSTSAGASDGAQPGAQQQPRPSSRRARRPCPSPKGMAPRAFAKVQPPDRLERTLPEKSRWNRGPNSSLRVSYRRRCLVASERTGDHRAERTRPGRQSGSDPKNPDWRRSRCATGQPSGSVKP